MTNDVSLASQFLWYEKYRPKKLEDLILPDSHRTIFNRYIENNEIPHLLFSGPPGSGKTTLSWILINEIVGSDCDVLWLNGSSKKDRSVSNIDEIADTFLMSASLNSDIKIVFIDEADGLKNDAQRSLKNIIEEHSENNRFIMTCNDIHLMNDAIQSRLTAYHFKPLDTDVIMKQMVNILSEEKIEYKESDLRQIVNVYKPDMRTILNTAERLIMVDGDCKCLRFSKEDLLGLDKSEKALVSLLTKLLQYTITDPKFNAVLDKCTGYMSERYLNYKLVLIYLFEKETKMARKYIWGKYLNSIKSAISEKAHIFCAIWEAAGC